MELAQETTKQKKPRKLYMIIGIAIAVVLVAAAIGLLVYDVNATLSGDKIYPGIYSGDTTLEGMSEKEATDAIEKSFAKYIQDKTVTLTSGEESYEVNISTLNPVIDSDALAKKAMDIGRKGNILKRYLQVKKLKNGGKQSLPFDMTLDEKILYADIAYFGSSLLESEGVVSFDYETNEVTIDTDKTNRTVDTDKVIKTFETTVNAGKFDDVELIFTDTPDNEDRAELLYNLIARDPVDAQMVFEDGTLEFIDEIDGIDIDRNELVNAVASGGVATLPFTPVPAQIDKEELKKQSFSTVIASYTTRFSLSHSGRTNNIIKAAQKINGHIMMPGDEFSYNGVVGKRTIEAGFDYANAYMGNKIIQEVGGGICQISSTLYAAVLYADLKVTKRYNHNLPVSYVPLGMDATVSYGTLDFCFVNDTDKPIMINASVNGGTAYVSINGFEKNENKKVEIYTKTIGTKAFEEEKVVDPTVTEPVISQNGVNGATVETYKVVYENGVEKSRKKLHTSTYQPENKIIHVPPEPEETEEVAEEIPEEVIPAEGEVVEQPVNDAPVDLVQ